MSPDAKAGWAIGGCTILLLATLAFAMWSGCYADCDSIGWMPVKDLPARCLPGRR